MTHDTAINRDAMAVLVTGASSGIGEACATYLAAKNVPVFASVRNERQQAALLTNTPGIRVVNLDVTDETSIASARDAISNQLCGEPLTGIVHSAGIAVPGPLEMLPVAAVREQLEVNVIGPFAVTQALLPLMTRTGGRIIFVGSTSGNVARTNCGAYCASKAALRLLAEVWRQELAPIGQHVCLLELDKFNTPIWAKSRQRLEQAWQSAAPELRRRYDHLEKQPFAFEETKMTSPHEIALQVWQILTAQCPPPVVRME